ncbi:MAG: carbohydrate kinase family protein [Armatimonadota bacterium]
MNRDVVVVGEANPDLLASGIQEMPRLGTEVLCERFEISLGGSSALAAAGMARLGLDVAFVSKVGGDLFGRFVLEELGSKGVDASRVIVDPSMRTGVSIILSLPRDRGIVTFQGTMSALSIEEIDIDFVTSFRHLHVSSFFLQEALQPFLPWLFQRAREVGMTTSLDTGWDPKEKWNGVLRQVLEYVDVFLPNELEATAVAGAGDVESALGVLAKMVPGIVAVKLGEKGAVAVCGGEVVRHSGYKVPVVDTTGAGDCFNAGFLYGFLRGESLYQCLSLGCACGALSVTAVGGASAQPTLDEARRLIQQCREA